MSSTGNTDKKEDINIDKVRYAQVIVDISTEALDRIFSYRIPASMEDLVVPGARVQVPFGAGNRMTDAYVIDITDQISFDPSKVKDIDAVDSNAYTIESNLIRMAFYLKETCGSTMIQALRTVLPVKSRVRPKVEGRVILSMSLSGAEDLAREWERKHYSARARVLRLLIDQGSIAKKEAVAAGLTHQSIMKIAGQGIWRLEERIRWRNPYPDLKKKEERPELNEEQTAAFNRFREDYDAGERPVYLLWGVTGSGKTEVYLSMIEKVISEGKQAIVLVPEISLTYQTVKRFCERFGERIAVINSRMSAGERNDAVQRIRRGEADIVIGPRSALFAPVPDLGIIIVDEEHDRAYKSEQTPKYHAVPAAVYRASLSNASLVLGSATPSVESFSRAVSGEYTLLTLRKRPSGSLLPSVEIADLREEFLQGNRSMFSRKLKALMEDRIRKKEQIMLFINRRGFAGFVSCRSCGHVIRCPHCDVSLTLHRNKTLSCHYCGYTIPYDRTCPSCGSPFVAAFGLGTEKVEAALAAEFPGVKVLRMDADTTRKKHAHDRILEDFSEGRAQILVGTQMIVKGHDYPGVTLMGILAADLSLFAQDFRSAEATFDLLCQAAGRSGRGSLRGDVVIQTYTPGHYAVTAAARQSYEDFYENEIAYRRMMGYPPCGHLLAILVQSDREEEAELAAARIGRMLIKSQEEAEDPVRILAPGKARLSRLKDIYRHVLFLKHRDRDRLLALQKRLEPVVSENPMFSGVSVEYDLDPVTSY